MCNCINIEMGSYSNQVVVKPFWKDEPVGIDKCILYEILSLWARGIKTAASCCGHNKVEPVIMVYPEYVEEMLKLGYKQQPFREDTFYSKSIEVNKC